MKNQQLFLSEFENSSSKIFSQEEFAPLIAAICDEQIEAEDVWKFPEWLINKLGTLKPEELLKHNLRQLLEEYLKDKCLII